MTRKALLSAILMLCAIISLAAADTDRHLFVYRNDHNFHKYRIGEGLDLMHSTDNSGSLITPDSLRIPLAAIDSITLRDADVPVLRLWFPENPELSWAPNKTDYIMTVMNIEGNGMVESVDSLQLTVRGRGNSTWWFAKKPLRLKFSKKTSICGFKKAKNYVLLADHLDQSLMRNAAALWLAQKLGVPCSNHFLPCHVYANDQYAGAYLLTEKIGINSASVDIDEETGMLFELSEDYDEDYRFRSAIHQLPVMVKDPDLEEVAPAYPDGVSPEEVLRRWEEDFNRAERLAREGKGSEAFDLESFVNYTLVYAISKNNDVANPRSCFLWKEALGADILYKFGPAWDFDIGFNFNYRNDGVAQPNLPGAWPGFNKLMADIMRDPGFKALFKERFDYFEAEVYPEFLDWIEEYSRMIEPLARLNGLRWPGPHYGAWAYRPHDTFDNVRSREELKEWIITQVSWLHDEIAGWDATDSRN